MMTHSQNDVLLEGYPASSPEWSHENHGTQFYRFLLEVPRLSGTPDILPVLLRADLLVAAALFHDIGKLDELSTFPENDYTDEGQLLGHIMIGAMQVQERIAAIPDFPKKLANELIHCILAHHGELEFGSPKKPALAEAVALSFADNMDAKMETMREAFSKVPEGNTDWLGFNRLFDSNIRMTSKS